ncbi:uncharacterized protein [Panulirus ornatus]|uniref:uncharacterized protein n=1 Tax=Panulirus ornatus TaxID=150431 RepID=UPI003A86C182
MSGSILLSLGTLLVVCHVVTVAGGTLQCQTEGRFPHPDDCGSYVDCLPTGADGRLEAREGYCFGFPYSPSQRRCVSHDQMPNCVIKAPRGSVPIPSLQFLCGENSGSTGCHHCKIAYQCIDGKAYVTLCGESDICSDDERFGGGACLPYSFETDPIRCRCDKLGLAADSYNNTYFIFCDTSTSPPTQDMYQCPDGKTFNSDSKTCEESGDSFSEEPAETPACDGSTDTKVNPNDCSWSYTCLPDGTVKSVPCKRSEYFDESTGSCAEKCSVVGSGSTSPGDLCTGVGIVKDPADCTKYHLCTEVGKEPVSTKTCPEGNRFDINEKKCVPGLDGCSFDYTQCPGHADLNC